MNDSNQILDAPEWHPREIGEYAGFWRRFAAAFIDGILLMMLGWLIRSMMGVGLFDAGVGMRPGFSSIVASMLTPASLLSTCFGWLYFAYLESSERQATLGKQAMGIRVLTVKGEQLSFLQATGRHFAKWLSLLFLMIGYLMQPFTARKQALHDILAGAVVVKD